MTKINNNDETKQINLSAKTKYLGIFMVVLAALFYLYEYFLRVSPSVLEKELMSSFQISASGFGLLAGMYFYAYTPMQLLVGILVDRINIKYIFIFAVLCCVIGTFIIASTSYFYIALIGRFLQGFGSAFAFVGALKVASDWMDIKKFAFFAGICSSLGFLGAGFGEIFISILSNTFDWQYILHGFALFGLVLAILFYIFLGKKSPSQKLKKSKKIPFKVFLTQFFQVLKNSKIWLAGFISFCMFLPTSVFAGLWGIPYLESLHNYSTSVASTLTAAIFIGWAFGCPLMGYISDRLGKRFEVIMVAALIAAFLSLIILYVSSLNYWSVLICCFLFGVFSGSQILTFAIGRDVVTHEMTGTAMAFVNTLAMVGGLLFQPLVGNILNLVSGVTSETINPVYHIADYEKALAIVPIVLFLSSIILMIYLFLKRKS